jgi:hypothetical protein
MSGCRAQLPSTGERAHVFRQSEQIEILMLDYYFLAEEKSVHSPRERCILTMTITHWYPPLSLTYVHVFTIIFSFELYSGWAFIHE